MTRNTHIRIGIIGAGAFGTALGHVLCTPFRSVYLYSLDPDFPEELKNFHTNRKFLPGHTVNPLMKGTTSLSDMEEMNILILAVPSAFMRSALHSLAPFLKDKKIPLISVTKGLDSSSGSFMSQLIESIIPQSPIAILTGPSYVSELIRHEPTGLTLACARPDTLSFLEKKLATPSLILEATSDIMGAQIGGVLKNVIAIASGFISGKDLGENARAILMVQGIAEMILLGKHFGANAQTFSGFSGLGDLLLTAMNDTSRNTSFGKALAQGKVTPSSLSPEQTVEGISTARILSTLLKNLGISLPICSTVAELVTDQCSQEEALNRFLFAKKKSMKGSYDAS